METTGETGTSLPGPFAGGVRLAEEPKSQAILARPVFETVPDAPVDDPRERDGDRDRMDPRGTRCSRSPSCWAGIAESTETEDVTAVPP